jgi:hypothetical protein
MAIPHAPDAAAEQRPPDAIHPVNPAYRRETRGSSKRENDDRDPVVLVSAFISRTGVDASGLQWTQGDSSGLGI